MAVAGLLVILAAYGLVFGSFLNVVGIRVLKGESIVYPPSHCVHCHHRLKALDLVPVLSYLFLRGRCRYCRAPVSPIYPIGEAVTAAGFVLCGWQLGFSAELFAGLLLVCIMVVISITDIREMLIPDVIVFPAAAAALLLRLFVHPEPLWTYLAGAAAGSGAMLLTGWLGMRLFKKESMGGGDVKLYLFAGLMLGLPLTILSIFAACVIGLLTALITYNHSIRDRQPIAFGPSIALGCFLSYLWGTPFVEWYLSLLAGT